MQIFIASMGPGCFYPGNRSMARASACASSLQWGRDVSIPEIRLLSEQLGRLVGFTGPRMFLSRNYGCYRSSWDGWWASMGPGCFYPGNDNRPTLWTNEFPLQWGRDVSIPEMARVTSI